MNAYLRVGVIIKPHGLKGEVKVYPTTDDPRRFGDLKKLSGVWADDELENDLDGDLDDSLNSARELEIEGVKYFKNLVIIKFNGVDSVDDAISLKGMELYIPREEGVELDDGEYYIADIIDMEVFDDLGQRIGIVRDVLETGANDVYIVKRDDNGRDLLLPAIDECILDVDIENNIMTVHMMDGLLDL